MLLYSLNEICELNGALNYFLLCGQVSLTAIISTISLLNVCDKCKQFVIYYPTILHRVYDSYTYILLICIGWKPQSLTVAT